VDVALGVLLGVWLVVSAVAQLEVLRPGIARVRRLDLFSLVPQYNFFAPRPGTKDFHLMVRATTSSGEFGRWRELSPLPHRAWWNCLWNPARRPRKALFDLATTLAKESQAVSRTAVQVSISYLVLLNHVSAAARLQAPARVQFLLAVSNGTCSTEPPRPLFISHIHEVEQ
jgi:hypothetical protein